MGIRARAAKSRPVSDAEAADGSYGKHTLLPGPLGDRTHAEKRAQSRLKTYQRRRVCTSAAILDNRNVRVPSGGWRRDDATVADVMTPDALLWNTKSGLILSCCKLHFLHIYWILYLIFSLLH